jgi:hypothetical protein
MKHMPIVALKAGLLASMFLCALGLAQARSAPMPQASKDQARPTYDLASGQVIYLPEPQYNAGDIVQGTTIHHDFPIENLSPLCVTITIPWREAINLSPYEKSAVACDLDTAYFYGPIHKTLSLSTGMRPSPILQLELTANIVRCVAITPAPNQQLGLVCQGQERDISFSLSSSDNEPFLIIGVSQLESPDDYGLSYSLERLENGSVWKFNVHLSVESRLGPVIGRWKLYTSFPEQPELTLAVYGTCGKIHQR